MMIMSTFTNKVLLTATTTNNLLLQPLKSFYPLLVIPRACSLLLMQEIKIQAVFTKIEALITD